MNMSYAEQLRPRQIAIWLAPFFAILLARWAANTDLAAAYPLATFVLFVWIVADSMMLALMVNSPGQKPSVRAVFGALATAGTIVFLAAPETVSQQLMSMPAALGIITAIVILHLLWGLMIARRAYLASNSQRLERLAEAAAEIMPPLLVRFAVAEIKLLHLALFQWNAPPEVPAGARGYAYHKHLAPMLAMLLALQSIEIGVLHIFIVHWNKTIAYIFMAIGFAGLVYMIGLIKSFRVMPILITGEGIHVRAGILIAHFIPFENIESIATNICGEEVRSKTTLNAALLAWPNIIIKLKKPVERKTFIRKRAPISAVAFRLDNPRPFYRLALWRIDKI